MDVQQLNDMLGMDIFAVVDIPEDDIEREEFVAELMEVFFERLMMTVTEKLSDDDTAALEAMFDTGASMQSILTFASTQCADFPDVVRAELTQFRADLAKLTTE